MCRPFRAESLERGFPGGCPRAEELCPFGAIFFGVRLPGLHPGAAPYQPLAQRFVSDAGSGYRILRRRRRILLLENKISRRYMSQDHSQNEPNNVRAQVVRKCADEIAGCWGNYVTRCVVDSAAVCLSRSCDVYCLFNMGCIPGDLLLALARRCGLPFAVLFTRVIRGFAACDIRTQTELVACVAHFFSGPPGFMGSGGFSADLLLLPRSLLQSVLGRSARMRGR